MKSTQRKLNLANPFRLIHDPRAKKGSFGPRPMKFPLPFHPECISFTGQPRTGHRARYGSNEYT